MKYLIVFILLFFVNCSSTKDIRWSEEDDYVIIQISEITAEVETYYAEITLESGRRIAVELGLPDKNGTFRLKNNFGRFTIIKLYTNLDLE
ncbi:MAG: hypothetical protein IPM56_04370 [Ignavibacteriales bacterium]|nr:MAG: hypothetical protein IPM56_04370 [Ignavibacteriales bacterium]